MTMQKQIPTNIITGFLGSGKTTAILHLLKQKPPEETWAVLVNEFGEIGIDGALLDGASLDGTTKRDDIAIREVPGGCMCCVAGLPMQIGLNMLIARSKPDRLLIEPTGLGHPQEIINTLQGDYYNELLSLEAIVCLVDPRNLDQPHYLENDNFQDQIHLADVLVATKTDLCSDQHKTLFETFVNQLPEPSPKTDWISAGKLPAQWLRLPHQARQATKPKAHHSAKQTSHQHNQERPESLSIPEGQSFVRKENKGQNHFSCGWLFDHSTLFSFDQLYSLILAQNAERFKGVVITDQGIKGFNMQDGVVSIIDLEDAMDSRLEMITNQPVDWNDLEKALLAAIV